MKSRDANRNSTAFLLTLRRFMREKTDSAAGASAVEFAILTPLLILTAAAIFDFGMGFYRKTQVASAARAGAQYAIAYGFNAAAITTAVVSATGFSGISASPPPNEYCGCPSSAGVVNRTCGSICSTGAQAGTYVGVSAQGTYTTWIPYPGIPSSYTFTTETVVRIQ